MARIRSGSEPSEEAAIEERADSAPEGERKGGPFGGLSPAEAARRRHAVSRERQAGAQKRGVVVEVDEAKVVQALRAKAEGGDVSAARELREWIARLSTQDQQASLYSLLSREQRQQVREWLIEREQQDGRTE